MSFEHKREVDREAERVERKAAAGASDRKDAKTPEATILGPVTKPGGTGLPSIVATASTSGTNREQL